MTRKLELYKAYGSSHYGFEPIIVGVNAARMGISLHDVLHGFSCWVGSGYDEAFFESIVIGYHNAFNEDYLKDLTQITHASCDINFILDNLSNNPKMRDYESNHDEYYETLNRGVTTMQPVWIFHKKYPIEFCVYYTRTISWDGSEFSYWHIDFKLKHNIGRCAIMMGHNDYIKIEDDTWRGGVNCRGCSEVSGWYEQHNRKTTIAHSSSVAKLINILVDNFIKKYNLDSTSRLGDLSPKKMR